MGSDYSRYWTILVTFKYQLKAIIFEIERQNLLRTNLVNCPLGCTPLFGFPSPFFIYNYDTKDIIQIQNKSEDPGNSSVSSSCSVLL